MKKILTLLLLICFVLSLFTYVFLGIQSFSFEEAYTSTLTFLTNIGSIFAPLKNITEYARYAVEFIKTMFDFGVTTVEKIINVVSDLPGTISGFITEAVTDIGNFFTNLGDRISQFFINLGNRFSDFISNLGDRIYQFFNNLTLDMSEWFTDLGTNLAGRLDQVRDRLSSSFTDFWEKIKSWFKSTF